jgi:hypothetical protein
VNVPALLVLLAQLYNLMALPPNKSALLQLAGDAALLIRGTHVGFSVSWFCTSYALLHVACLVPPLHTLPKFQQAGAVNVFPASLLQLAGRLLYPLFKLYVQVPLSIAQLPVGSQDRVVGVQTLPPPQYTHVFPLL